MWTISALDIRDTSAARRGGIRWDDIDWPRGRIRLVRQINWLTLKPEKLKGRKKPEHKLIDVPPGAMAMLADLQTEARPGVPWVFATSAGTHYLPNNVARGYRQLIEALRDEQLRLQKTPIRQLSIHTTRHTFASQAFAKMMDPSWVSRQLGHHSVAFTLDTYVHLLPGRRDFTAVDFGGLDASGHNEVTRPQIRAKDDDRTLH